MQTQAEPIFHEGEIAIQKKLGVAKRIETIAPRMIRDVMVEQHKTFYSALPYLFAGYHDQNDKVWASILVGKPGFISFPTDKKMHLKTSPLHNDPMVNAIKNADGLRIGLLGIDLSNRRRNRASTQLTATSDGKISLDVLQAFGNCPQYIQIRETEWKKDFKPEASTATKVTEFDGMIGKLIKNADTFFVASTSKNVDKDAQSRANGADVSHRGGQAGFVRVDDAKTLTIPDYRGNNLFNTLGNIEVNPHVGLLFIDFSTGDVLTLTGKAKTLWHSDAHLQFKGAQRLWQFTLDHGFLLQNALPMRWRFDEYSPVSLMTGTWDDDH
ncbi:MAG: pyridoxamine 5'-phosphate oxidase family protein [Pseudomonadota bacterium]